MTSAPPRSSGSSQLPAAGLPVQLSTFIGREREIATVGELLRSTRLLTLTGVGGAGKTRLAAEVATRAAPLYSATGWVDLASLSDPELVGQVVANTLGYREEGGRSAVETLLHRVCTRPTLVVLDNCEHLVDACAQLAESLLKGCSEIRILATSREALGVSGEQAWLVPPLSLPADRCDAGALLASEAGRLFLERARAVLPSFRLDDSNAAAVAQICRRLDGIPLAIELAAARIRVLAPEQIAARLDDSFRLLAGPGRTTVPRHRTLRETIDWSHALLDEAEAALFRRLAVFAGSFSLDAVEAICSDPPVSEAGILDLLSALVDKSLVIMETCGSEARYRLLETLRQYGQERLDAAGERAELGRRHAHFFTDLVAARERDTFGGAGDPEWAARLVAEEGNLRAAGDWAEATGDCTMMLRLCSALHWHWFARGHFRDGRERLEAALRHADEASPLCRGKAHAAAATTSFWLGELDRIAPHAAQAVALLRDQNDPWHLAYALVTMALGLSTTDLAAAESLIVEGTALARTQGPHTVLLAFALYWHGRFAMGQGKLDLAERLFSEGHAVGSALKHPPAIAHTLAMLGLLELERGDLGQAAAHLREALRIHSDNSDALGYIWSLEGLARLAARVGQPERSAQILAGVRAERDRIGAAWAPGERKSFDALAAQLEQQLGAERAEAAMLKGRTMSVPDLLALGLAPGSEPSAPVAGKAAAAAPATPTTATLRVQTLGPLRIIRDGVLLDREAWASAKPRELLLLLLCHPEGRTREQVGLAFWPDASAEQVRNNFHVTLHRLRKTLGGAHWVVLSDERYRLNSEVSVDYDAVRFEPEVAAGLARLRKQGDAAPLEAALALYQGDFLAQENAGDWHLETRDRLRHRYLEALAALAEQRMKQDRWPDAADLWRRLIAADELSEPAFRGLMTCHARLGERSEIQRIYQRLTRALQKELAADPEPETAQLYRRLVSNPD